MKLPRLLLPAPRALRFFTCGILMAVASLWPPEKARAAAYTFTNIADSDDIFAPTVNPFTGIGDAAISLNNSGTVAFASRLDNGGRGVFTGNGGPIQTIVLTSGPVFSFVYGGSINSAGTVAFNGTLKSGVEGIFTSSGGVLSTVALSTEPTFSFFGSPVINDVGTVGFQVTLTDGSRSILTRTGGVTKTIAAESGPFLSGVGGDLSMNSSGTVAFQGGLENGGGAFFTGNGGPLTTVALGMFGGVGTSAINDAGNVTFINGARTIVYRWNGSGLQVVADISGPFSGFGERSSVNNVGQFAFLAGLDTGGGGLFVGPDPVADRVILAGESLFGSTISRFTLVGVNENFGSTDINDAGQVAFHYQLANGRQGIAVATPTPEPGTGICLALGALLLGMIRQRGERSKKFRTPTTYGPDR